MTETKQGVAQRVMGAIEERIDAQPAEFGYVRELLGARLGGAKSMHHELSAEARAMIAKWKIPNVPEDLIYSQALHDMARRLGLDLEDEDS